MKKQKFNGKLNLNKETISRLQDEEMSKIEGGVTFGCLTTLITRGCNATFAGNTCTPLTKCDYTPAPTVYCA